MARTVEGALHGFMVCALVGAVMLPGVSNRAYAEVIDLEPPMVDMQNPGNAPRKAEQIFNAVVIDDIAIDSVRLFWRPAGTTRYLSVPMYLKDTSDHYSATIKVNPELTEQIQYYISATDSGGNRTLHGYAFSPLVRRLVEFASPSALPVPEPATAPLVVQNRSGDEPGRPEPVSRTRKIVLGVLGVLALGALVANADDGGGSGGTPAGDNPGCAEVGCTVTITVAPP